jgi:hypothetical protein
MNHLIKLPFSIHATSRNIAIPVYGHDIIQKDKTCHFLSLSDVMRYYQNENGKYHPLFANGLEIYTKWLNQYIQQ